MNIDPNTIKVSGEIDRPKSGMWHCGHNPCWITVTHLPTMQSVTFYTKRSQNHGREQAMMLLELMLEDWDGQPASFPENIKETND